jgi:hypothetical protein
MEREPLGEISVGLAIVSGFEVEIGQVVPDGDVAGMEPNLAGEVLPGFFQVSCMNVFEIKTVQAFW